MRKLSSMITKEGPRCRKPKVSRCSEIFLKGKESKLNCEKSLRTILNISTLFRNFFRLKKVQNGGVSA